MRSIVAAADGSLRWPEALSGTWLTGTRRAIAIDSYRIAVAALLALRCMSLLRELPVLADSVGWLSATRLPWLAPGAALRVSLGLGVALALAIVVGIAPRLSAAALWAISVWLRRALSELSTFDDYLACFACAWLVLLPTGHTLSLTSPRTGFDDRRRVEGWTTLLLVCHVAIIGLDLDRWQAYAPTWPESPAVLLGLSASTAGWFAPNRAVRIAAIACSCVLHAALSLASGLHFAHGLVIATSLLALGERDAGAGARALGVPAVLAATLVFTSFVYVAADRLGYPAVLAANGGRLEPLGLTPSASGRRPLPADVVLSIRSDAPDASALPAVLSAGERSALLLSALLDPRVPTALRSGTLHAIVAKHCARAAAEETGRVVSTRPATALAWYACAAREGREQVVMLEGAKPTRESGVE